MSASTKSTREPEAASIRARFQTTVVLPSPGIAEVTSTERVSLLAKLAAEVDAHRPKGLGLGRRQGAGAAAGARESRACAGSGR